MPPVLDPALAGRFDRHDRPTRPPPTLNESASRLSHDAMLLIALGDARPNRWPWADDS